MLFNLFQRLVIEACGFQLEQDNELMRVIRKKPLEELTLKLYGYNASSKVSFLLVSFLMTVCSCVESPRSIVKHASTVRPCISENI